MSRANVAEEADVEAVKASREVAEDAEHETMCRLVADRRLVAGVISERAEITAVGMSFYVIEMRLNELYSIRVQAL